MSLSQTFETFSQQRVVIVIGGPIASGKSTLARAVARHLTERGFVAATIDLDLVYEMLDHTGAPKHDAATWSRARRIAAAFTDGLLDDGARVVVAEGDFVEEGARAEFLTSLRPGLPVRFVTLTVPLATALVRVEKDKTRGLSRDPVFLSRHYEEIAESLTERAATQTDLILDTSSVTVSEAARAIMDWSLAVAPEAYEPRISNETGRS